METKAFNMRLYTPLYNEIKKDSEENKRTVREICTKVFAEYYGYKFIPEHLEKI